MAKKQVSKELLQRWNERVALIARTTFDLGECDETRQARIKRSLEDYGYFAKTYFPHLATSECADFQIDAARYIESHPRARALFEWARGHAKSTHISCLIPLWLLARSAMGLGNGFHFLLLVSKSEDMAKGLLADLQAELSNNEVYRQDFGIKAEKGSEWQSGRFSISDGTTFVALGRGQSPRGLKKGGRRPDYIVVDDIDDDLIIKNEKRCREAFDWMMTALFGTMLAGDGRFILVGNRISKKSILSLYAETKGIHHTTVNILDKNGNISWKSVYTMEKVSEMRETQGERKFYREFMNSPVDEGSVFKLEWMHYGKILPLKEYVKIISYTDPSFRSSTSNDYKATIVVGKTKEGYYHVLKAFAGQCSVAEMVSWHYQIEDWIQAQGGGKLPRYYMEANFIQDLLLDEFEKEGISRGGRQIPITGDKRKKIDKFSRIETMQPLFERGFILFNIDEKDSEGMKILVEQLLGIEKGSRLHDDAPDALESAIYMLNKTGKGAGKYRIAQRRDLSV